MNCLRPIQRPRGATPRPLCAALLIALACASGCCNPDCDPGQECCGRGCVDLNTDPENCGACGNICPQGTTCVAGQCVTPPGCNPACSPNETCCDGTCVDLNTNTQNCGACGNVCPEGTVCSGGACVGMRQARKR